MIWYNTGISSRVALVTVSDFASPNQQRTLVGSDLGTVRFIK